MPDRIQFNYCEEMFSGRFHEWGLMDGLHRRNKDEGGLAPHSFVGWEQEE